MVKTTIAIIGAAGERGASIVKALSKGNYSLLLKSDDHEALKRLAFSLKKKTSVSIISCAKEACWEADVVILAVPYEEEIEAVKYIKDVVTQKLVVSFAAKGTTSCQETLEKLLPYSRVVQAVVNEKKQCLITGSNKDAVREASILLESVFEVVTGNWTKIPSIKK